MAEANGKETQGSTEMDTSTTPKASTIKIEPDEPSPNAPTPPPLEKSESDEDQSSSATETEPQVGQKRKRRWGSARGEGSARKRSKRWGEKTEEDFAVTLDPALEKEFLEITMKLAETGQQLLNPAFALSLIPPDQRDPEPEPIYDPRTGNRTNTPEVVFRQKLEKMRQKLVRRALEIKPDFVPPIDFKPTGLMHQVFIPHKKYPHVNFQGLIIGPRGANQKRMELETGCTIQIRGQGAGREGKAPGPTDDDELHVLIQGPTQEQIDKATKMVEFLVQDPNNKALVEYKAKQLRQLARMNGTLVEGNVCSICSEPGHHPWECPERTGAAWKPADVFCDVCGGEHLTDDCPLTGQEREDAIRERDEEQQEYERFVAELQAGGDIEDIPLPRGLLQGPDLDTQDIKALEHIPSAAPSKSALTSSIPPSALGPDGKPTATALQQFFQGAKPAPIHPTPADVALTNQFNSQQQLDATTSGVQRVNLRPSQLPTTGFFIPPPPPPPPPLITAVNVPHFHSQQPYAPQMHFQQQRVPWAPQPDTGHHHPHHPMGPAPTHGTGAKQGGQWSFGSTAHVFSGSYQPPPAQIVPGQPAMHPHGAPPPPPPPPPPPSG